MKKSFVFRKGLVIGIILLFIGASILPNISGDINDKLNSLFNKNDKKESRSILFFDDFNDNVKDLNKWSQITGNGNWWEQNQRTEIKVNAPYNDGIKSVYVPIIITDENSVKISFDMITHIDDYGEVGHLWVYVTDGTHWIVARYMRSSYEGDVCQYYWSNQQTASTIGTRLDGTWSNSIEIFSDRFQVNMDTFSSGWVYDSFFSSATQIRMYLYVEVNPIGCWLQAGYDNAKIEIIGENEPPIADFTWTPQYPMPGQTVTFDASASYDPDGTIELYEWDWDGDGTYDESHTTPTAQHSWSSSGNYPVTLRVTDNEGATGTVTKTVYVNTGNIPPVADFTWSPLNPEPEESITFDASESYDPDPDGYIDLYEWDWDDDGTYDDSTTDPIIILAGGFQDAGYYPVTLRVTDNDDDTDTETKIVHVIENQPPTAYIDIISPNPASLNSMVYFSGHGVDPDGIISEYYWESNIDGFLSSLSSFSTPYLSLGTHIITFKVKDDDGEWSQPDTEILTIFENNPPNKPSKPSGSTTGYPGYTYTYSTMSVDPEGDNIRYGWDWNSDLQIDQWTSSYYPSGTTINIDHSFPSVDTYYVSVKAEDEYGKQSSFSNPLVVNIIETANNPPSTPNLPSGPTSGLTGVKYDYSTSSTDPDGDKIRYAWDWDGDNKIDGWTSYYNSGISVTSSHSWDSAGTYYVKVLAEDENGAQSGWSSSLKIIITGNQKPKAYIDKIEPIYATTEETITFEGHGEDSDGTITEYRWESDIDGFLSNENSFQITGLSPGLHIISFWVKDNGNQWSNPSVYPIPMIIIRGLIFRPKEMTQYPNLFFLCDWGWTETGVARARASSSTSSGCISSGSSAFAGGSDSWTFLAGEFNIYQTKSVKLSSLISSVGGKLNVYPLGFSKSQMGIVLRKNVGGYWQTVYSGINDVDPQWTWEDILGTLLWFASLGAQGLQGFQYLQYLKYPLDFAEKAFTVYGVADLAWALTTQDCDYHTHTSNTFTLTPGYYQIYSYLQSDAQGGVLGSGNVIRFGQNNYITVQELTDKDSNILSNPYNDFQVITSSKIDVVITDSNNRFISKNYSEIPHATYIEKDIDFDDELNDCIYIPNPINGEYKISVIAEPNANPSDTFSIMYTIDGTDFEYIAEDIKISDIPSDPYTINIVSENLPLVEITYPTGLKNYNGIKKIRWYAIDNEQGEELPINIYYNDCNSEIWYQINKEPLDNTGIFYWDTTMVPDGKYLLKIEAIDNDGNIGYSINEQFLINNRNGTVPDNQPPIKPSTPSGETNGKAGEEYTYSCITTDDEYDPIYYLFDWDDDTTDIMGPIESGETVEVTHSWGEEGTYEIRVQATDIYGLKSEWSDPLVVTMPRDKAINTPFLNFLQSHPNLFPLFQRIMSQLGLQ